jgi:hypothetical protein
VQSTRCSWVTRLVALLASASSIFASTRDRDREREGQPLTCSPAGCGCSDRSGIVDVLDLMSSFVGLSSASKASLTAAAGHLQGQLLLTLHKAVHIKNSALSGGASDPYCTLTVGGKQNFRSTVCRDGGGHPEWQQQFLFTLPAAGDALPAKGQLHIQVFDASVGRDECIGRLDINLAQLLVPENADELPTDSEANGQPAYDPAEPDAQWHALAAPRDFSVAQGYLCLTAVFTGTGLEQAEKAVRQVRSGVSTSVAEAVKAEPVAAPAAAPAKSLKDGEHAIPQLGENGTAASHGVPAPVDVSAPAAAAPSIASPSASAAASVHAVTLQHPNPLSPTPAPLPAIGYPISPLAGTRPGTTANGRPMTSSARPRTAAAVEPAVETPTAAEEPELVTAYDIRHPHILQLVPAVSSGRYLCASCAGEGFGTAWRCTQGTEFTLHEACLQDSGKAADDEEESSDLPDMRLDPRHPRPLTWFEEGGDYVCKGCGGGGSGPVWRCEETKWDLHPGCMR